MAKQNQNKMKEHILESLHSILMTSTKRLLLALKKRRQVQKQIVILQKKPIQPSTHAGSARNQDLATGTP
jgi:hypothetical protein